MAKQTNKGSFQKYGEFDSAEELNLAAVRFRKEGDRRSLLELAKENGIDAEDAIDYFDGLYPELASTYIAALGKLEVEQKADKTIVNMVKQLCVEEQFAKSVRKKGKRISDISDILKAKNIGADSLTERQLFGVVVAYYLEGKTEARDRFEELQEKRAAV